MAEQQMHIDMVEVKAEDIIADRQSVYNSFISAASWSVGATIVVLVLIYLIFG